MKPESATQQLVGAMFKGMNGVWAISRTARLILSVWLLAATLFMVTTDSVAVFGATLFAAVLSAVALIVLVVANHHQKEAGVLLTHLHALSGQDLADHPVVKAIQGHKAALHGSQGTLAKAKALYDALEAGKDTLDAGHSGFGVSSLMVLTNPMMLTLIGCSLGVGFAMGASSPFWVLLWIFC